MDTRIARTIERFALLKKGNSVLVALSGGPDSVALLRLLDRLKRVIGIDLAAAHLDHGIRKKSSLDRAFCKNLCHSIGIRLHSKKIEIVEMARKKGLSLEETGRISRYEYFESLAARYGYDKIATGHTADDNAETVIYNMARGSGLRGLSGIQPGRGKIIRPLIEISKKEILSWLKRSKFDYIFDETNISTEYARNRIRMKIIPQLERLNPAAKGNILRLSRNIAEEIELIDKIVVSAYEKALVRVGKSKIVLDLDTINGYDQKLGKKLLIEAFRRLNVGSYSPSSEAISRAMRICNGRSGGKSPMGMGIWIEKSKKRVSISKQEVKREKLPLIIPGITEIPFSDLFLKSEVLNRGKVRKLKTIPKRALLDRELIGNGTVRYWKSGDKIRPFGMRGRRLLSDVFSDRGIPSFERNEIPLVVSGKAIAWIAGVMISDDFKVGPNTREILSIRLCER